MTYLQSHIKTTLASIFTLIFLLGIASTSQAHCDRVNGPVATDAQKALETGDISHALIWVTDQQAEELKSIFEQSLNVYAKEQESQALAERYFMSETVRLHREAEGMPFTGLKPAQPSSRDIQIAEQGLASGELAPVTDMLANEIRKKTTELYKKAIETRSKKDNSVKAGREWVDAYVQYIVYVHKLYQKIQAGPAHGVGE